MELMGDPRSWTRRRPSIVLLAMFAVAVVLVVRESAAVRVVRAQASGGDQLQACVRNTGRGPNVRVIGPGDTCDVNETALQLGGSSGLTVVLRENEQVLSVAPGDRAVLASPCREGEVVVGGGPTRVVVSLRIVSSSLFFDSVHSGWRVDYSNDGTEAIVEQASVGAECTPGTMTNG